MRVLLVFVLRAVLCWGSSLLFALQLGVLRVAPLQKLSDGLQVYHHHMQ